MTHPFKIHHSQFIIHYSPSPFDEYRIQPPSPTDLTLQTSITDRGFTGHKHDDDIGLIYMNARYYVPSIGRFASADTIIPYPNDPQSHNRFSYVRNNPMNSIDPTGHIDCPDPDASCAPATSPPSPAPICSNPIIACLNNGSDTFPGGAPTDVINVTGTTKPVYPGIGGFGTNVLGLPEEVQLAIAAIISNIEIIFDLIELAASTLSIADDIIQMIITQILASGLVPETGGLSLIVAGILQLVAYFGQDKAEDILSYPALATAIFSDFWLGTSYVDNLTGELVLGQNTVIALVEQGIDKLIPGTQADFILNGAGLALDLWDRITLQNNYPNLIELRVSLSGGAYLVWYSDAWAFYFP